MLKVKGKVRLCVCILLTAHWNRLQTPERTMAMCRSASRMYFLSVNGPEARGRGLNILVKTGRLQAESLGSMLPAPPCTAAPLLRHPLHTTRGHLHAAWQRNPWLHGYVVWSHTSVKCMLAMSGLFTIFISYSANWDIWWIITMTSHTFNKTWSKTSRLPQNTPVMR